MPITDFLGDLKVDPEAKRIMGVAFEMVRVAVGFAGRGDLPNEVIAKKIIELAKAEGRNPDLLCEAVLEEFREQRFDPRLMRHGSSSNLPNSN